MQKPDTTFDTYSLHADNYLSKFSLNGVRVRDIDETFTYISKKNPIVLELGCAGGRDAHHILTKTHNYTGIDYIPQFIEEARKANPEGHFSASDIRTYTPEKEVDIVFAFASLLHLSKEELQVVCENMYKTLPPRGLFRVSLKQSDEYKKEKVSDQCGERVFYYYDKDTLLSLAHLFTPLFMRTEEHAGTQWIEALFQK